MSTLKGLRARRDAALKARFMDIPVAGLDGVIARFTPTTAATVAREKDRHDKSKDKNASNIRLNANILAASFDSLRTVDGEVLSEGFTEDLMREFVPDVPVDSVSESDVIRGLFTEDFPLFKAAGELTNWSQGVESEETDDLEN